MEILKLSLTLIDNRKFNVSAEIYSSEISQLPFFDDGGNSHIYTVLNALNSIDNKYSSQNIESLANALPIPIKFESRRKKIQIINNALILKKCSEILKQEVII
jgi:hypothetical protein